MRLRNWLSAALLFSLLAQMALGEVSHPPMRPLPAASDRPLPDGPTFFVDATSGNDANDGSKTKPWLSVHYGLRQLSPGDTLCLRGGTYFEHADVPVSGEEDNQSPFAVILANWPSSMVVYARFFIARNRVAATRRRGVRRVRFDSRRIRSCCKADRQRVSRCRLGALLREGRGPTAGAPATLPIRWCRCTYRTINDLRDDSMLWDVDSKFEDQGGVYCGPGLWFDRKTARIHIRLAPTTLEGLGEHAYRGETDPRKLKLCISGP